MKMMTKMRRREALVREVKRERGMSWREVAQELGYEGVGALDSLWRAARPHDATLVKLRDWLARYGRVVGLAELVD